MRKFLLFAAVVLAALQLSAAPVDLSSAKATAQKFIQQNTNLGRLRAPIKGDVNLDGEVTAADLVALGNYVLGDRRAAVYGCENGDISGDGRISSLDVCMLRKLLTE
jgi:hypothetical protein